MKEEVRKQPDRPEADRFFNYPYTAIKEALANAVYHRDYAIREPIEISIHPDRIEILSFPGPMPPLRVDDLNKGHVRVRSYRNRRIGDYLKELHLTEGRCTGVPKIKKAMEDNGSPPPLFQTDKDDLSFLTVLSVHPRVTRDKHTSLKSKTHQLDAKTHQPAGAFARLPEELQQRVKELSHRPSSEALWNVISALCRPSPLTAQEIADILERKDKKHLVRVHLTPMVEAGLLSYLYPEELESPRQAYIAVVGRQGR